MSSTARRAATPAQTTMPRRSPSCSGPSITVFTMRGIAIWNADEHRQMREARLVQHARRRGRGAVERQQLEQQAVEPEVDGIERERGIETQQGRRLGSVGVEVECGAEPEDVFVEATRTREVGD